MSSQLLLYIFNSNAQRYTFMMLLPLVVISSVYTQGELPPISTFTYSEHGGGMQNWKIDQSDNNKIYVANNEGLLEYDGERWKLYPSVNQTLMRSVKAHKDRVYTGCYMDFGYWKADSTGYLIYQSLTHLLSEPMMEDEQVWNIHHSGEWIIFQSLNRIFLYQRESDQIRVLDHDYDIARSFEIDGAIYFQSLGYGLFEIINGKSQLVSEASVFQEQVIIGLFNIGNKMMAVSDDARMIELRDDAIVEKRLSPITKGASIYSAVKLNDEEIALGTISLGVLIANAYGDIVAKYDQSDGLTNNTALSLYSDAEQSIWAGLDNGVNVIHKESMLRIARFEENIGAVYASGNLDGILYLGTNQGLYYKDVRSINTDYRLCEGTRGQVWNLEVIDGLLFCGHNNGVFIVKGETVINQVSEISGAWGFRKVPNRENLVLVGSYSHAGLHILQKKGQSWGFRNHIENYRMSSRFFEWIDDQSLIINHEYKGLYRIELDETFRRATQVIEDTSVEKGRHSGLAKHDGVIRYSKSGGLWNYNENELRFIKDTILSSLQASKDYISGKIVSTNDKLWLFTKDYIHEVAKDRFDAGRKITSIPLEQDYREGNYGYENITDIGDSRYLIGSSTGYSIIDLGTPSLADGHSIRLTDVSVSNNKSETASRISLQGGVELAHDYNTLSFTISSTSYDPIKTNLIQYRVNDSEWQQAYTASAIELEQLSPGSYLLEIRNTQSQIIDITYGFEIFKPWYQTHTALIGYLLGLLGLIFMINKAFERYYKREQRRLIDQNSKVLELQEMETRQVITKMENERLQQDIENKNRELGISTMHMTKQNEILGAIRSELAALKADKQIKSIIKLVDQNMNPEEDWNMFEKAFNEADKGFFKKVQLTHPELTPSDLKLCAYLRLNLSSKEIAPLLNISIRSVEIKRYRLRKKLNLEHEEGLVNYLLKL